MYIVDYVQGWLGDPKAAVYVAVDFTVKLRTIVRYYTVLGQLLTLPYKVKQKC